MIRTSIAAIVLGAVVCFVTLSAAGLPDTAGRPDIAGRWTLNRDKSQFPTDVGFGMDLASAIGAETGGSGGGRGGTGGGSGLTAAFRESLFDAKRRELLVDEVANPSPHLTIQQSDSSVTITDERGRSRTFHPNGRAESLDLGNEIAVAATARWEAAGLVVVYKVEQGRELRYTYSRTPDAAQLVVKVEFLEHGGHDTVTRVYQPTSANEPATPAPPAATPQPQSPVAPTGTPPAPPRLSDYGRPQGPPLTQGRGAAPIVPGGPDAELKGITNLGVVVEDLSSQAAACGLTQASIETAVSNSFSTAGFKVMRNADEDTYAYVQVMTTSASQGLCVSRYDVFLYSTTTATLSYQTAPQLVQVQLLHKGGLTGGGPATHGQAVVRGVTQYADEFAKRIRDANAR